MELRHLRYFLAVAEELHFGRAAHRLMIAQPPLSQQIRNLEREMGVVLFDRTSKRVTLTAAGEAFRSHVVSTLAQSEDAVRAAQRAHRGDEGILQIGFVGSASFTRLPSSIRAFRSRSPRVELVLRELRTPEQFEALLANRIDAGIVRADDFGHPLVDVRLLERERFVVALPTVHPLAKRTTIRISSLAEVPFVMYPQDPGPGLYRQVQQLCHAAGFEPKISQHASQIPTIVSFVAAGLGVAILPESVSTMKWPGVRFRPITGTNVQSVLGIAYLKTTKNRMRDRFIESFTST